MAIGDALACEEFTALDAYGDANEAARAFVGAVQKAYGSTDCYDIQRAMVGWCCDDPSKAERWVEAGGLTACAGLCAQVARTAAAIILDRSEA
jgi:hypothetical protein